jgi:hypothetical protein
MMIAWRGAEDKASAAPTPQERMTNHRARIGSAVANIKLMTHVVPKRIGCSRVLVALSKPNLVSEPHEGSAEFKLPNRLPAS